MLKSLFGKGFGASAEPREKLDLNQLKVLIEFFPIGRKLRYYPEFNKDIVLDTLIVAYSINDHFLYSMDLVETDQDDLPVAFRINCGKTRLPAGRANFQLLVPDTSDLEMKLDYMRRAQISRHGQFSVGNNISLISNAGMKGISTLDTEVAKQLVLRDGPYAHRNMILLTPEFDTLSVSDQRKKPRTRINVPATLLVPEEAYSGPCTIIDVSDAELRLRWGGHGPNLREGGVMNLDLYLGKEQRYLITGLVFRRTVGTCVVKLKGQTREERFHPFSSLDLLELKAGLLNYSK
jgi:hypothetical protein